MTNVEFEDLLRAGALGSLVRTERERLDELAAGDSERVRRVAEVDAVLEAFAAERELLAETVAVEAPFETGDPTLQRLSTAAARAERELRARLERPAATPAPTAPAARTGAWRRAVAWTALAAAAVLALLLWSGQLGGGEALDSRRPDDLRAGAALQLVLLQPTLTADARTISWAAVPGASGYDAHILDRSGAIVLERDPQLQKSTAWELSPTDYAALLRHRPLRLRVTALDGVGLPIGSSGDLEITLR